MDTYKQIDLTEYVQTGEGGNGKTYVTSADSDEILKVNNARLSTWEVVKHEYDVSKAVASLGIPVPAMYRIVQVGDAYGTIQGQEIPLTHLPRRTRAHRRDGPALVPQREGTIR